jgi:cell division protein FtsL
MSGTMQLPPKTSANAAGRKTGQVVHGRFRRPQRLRRMRRIVATLGGIMFGLLLVSSLTVYALRLQVEQKVNKLSQDTRNLDEMNKALAITVNKEQSYLQIAEKANRALPKLQATQEVLDVPLDKTALMALPKRLKLAPEAAPSLPGF